MIETIDDLIKELSKYPKNAKVFYATKYALIPLEVKQLDQYIAIDINSHEKHKYAERWTIMFEKDEPYCKQVISDALHYLSSVMLDDAALNMKDMARGFNGLTEAFERINEEADQW